MPITRVRERRPAGPNEAARKNGLERRSSSGHPVVIEGWVVQAPRARDQRGGHARNEGPQLDVTRSPLASEPAASSAVFHNPGVVPHSRASAAGGSGWGGRPAASSPAGMAPVLSHLWTPHADGVAAVRPHGHAVGSHCLRRYLRVRDRQSDLLLAHGGPRLQHHARGPPPPVRARLGCPLPGVRAHASNAFHVEAAGALGPEPARGSRGSVVDLAWLHTLLGGGRRYPRSGRAHLSAS